MTTLQTNANALAGALSDVLRAQVAQGLATQFGQLITEYQALQASTLAAETSPPPA